MDKTNRMTKSQPSPLNKRHNFKTSSTIVLESCKDKSQTRSHYLPYLLQDFFLLAIQIEACKIPSSYVYSICTLGLAQHSKDNVHCTQQPMSFIYKTH